MGAFIKNTTRFKGKKDHTSTLKLDMIIINAEKKGIIIGIILITIITIKRLKFLNLINTMAKEKSLNFNFFNLLYGSRTMIPPLKEENKLFILLI